MDHKVRPAKQNNKFPILPYSQIVGQGRLKLALEIAFISPRLGGVLIAGQRGTAKSTAVRAFAQMMYGQLPVTLPINATEDRVIGGWQIDELMRGEARPQSGLLEEANGSVLYIDEVNLLDDHIVNLILDVASTGVLVVQREAQSDQKPVSFSLVGTMNPEEGSLRPQLLDRFGLLVSVTAERDPEHRAEILKNVMAFDEAVRQQRSGIAAPFIEEGFRLDSVHRASLEKAQQRISSVRVDKAVKHCVALADAFKVEGHRGDYVLALAARALAAIRGDEEVTPEHIREVAPLALHHRRREFLQSAQWFWGPEDDKHVDETLSK